MSKKATLLIALAVILIVLTASYTINYYNTAQNTGETPSQNPPEEPPETPEGPQFVIPESPLGTLGLISALAAGFGMFTIIMKKRR